MSFANIIAQFRMPRFLSLLFFVEMWERFSYYGMRALLVLFLTEKLGFHDTKAYAIYSLFAALGYAGPVIGGLLADRLMGFRNMVFLGGLIMVLGHGMLVLVDLNDFLLYLGLGFIAVGTGLFKGNIANLLGCCYKPDDPERDNGFMMFYVSVNIGSFLASITCGYAAHLYGWHYGFGLAGVGMLLGLLIFWRYEKEVLGDLGMAPQPERLAASLLGGVSVRNVVNALCISAALGCALLLRETELFTKLLSGFGLLIVGALVYVFRQCTAGERQGLVLLLIMMFFSTCFFALEMQLGSLINFFTERNVDKSILGYTVPASISQAINPFSIIVFGPLLSGLFARFGHKWGMLRYGLGLVTMLVCFLLLYLSCSYANLSGEVPYLFLFVSILFMGVGELFIAPLLDSYCTILAPVRLRGFMMGVSLLTMSYSNLAGLLIAKFMAVPKAEAGAEHDGLASLAIYQAGFYNIMLFNLALVAVFALLYPYLQKISRKQMLV